MIRVWGLGILVIISAPTLPSQTPYKPSSHVILDVLFYSIFRQTKTLHLPNNPLGTEAFAAIQAPPKLRAVNTFAKMMCFFSDRRRLRRWFRSAAFDIKTPAMPAEGKKLSGDGLSSGFRVSSPKTSSLSQSRSFSRHSQQNL